MKNAIQLVIAAAAFATVSSVASAVSPISPVKNSDGSLVAGNFISTAFFTTQESATTGAQIGLQVRNRATNSPIAVNGSTYYVSAGNDPGNPNRTAWSFELQFSPGLSALALPTDYTFTLLADTNPAFGVETFATVTNAQIVGGDSLILNPAGIQDWTTDPTYVLSNSWNYQFPFLAGPTFANVPNGEYVLQFLAVSNAIGGETLAVTATVIVPEPASLSAIAGLGMLGFRRRRA